MKKIITMLILLHYGFCLAEPAQIDKSAVVTSVTVNSVSRTGSWLKWACEEYKSWHTNPGSLWTGTDTKKENLGSGLCAGYISGVIETYTADVANSCVTKKGLKPDIVLEYLEKHPELNGKPAAPSIIGAYLESCKLVSGN